MDCSLILDNFEKIIRPAAEITGLFTGGFFLSHYIRLFLCSSPRLPYLGVAKVSRAFFKETLDPFCARVYSLIVNAAHDDFNLLTNFLPSLMFSSLHVVVISDHNESALFREVEL